MPGYNGTGPMGAGPMTGRGRGVCNNDPDYGRPMPDVPYGLGRGLGYGRRAGYGCGLGFGPRNRTGLGRMTPGYRFSRGNDGALSGLDELRQLRAESEATRNILDDIQKRIAILEKNSA